MSSVENSMIQITNNNENFIMGVPLDHNKQERFSEEKYEFSFLQKIINSLILNSGLYSNPGIMHGKMGQCIFFALLYKQTRDRLYQNIYCRLIDEIYNEITITTVPDFEDGLAGIGWGIEYLAQKGFIKANTDEVLESIDLRIFHLLEQDTSNIGLLTGYSGYGFYLIKRLKNKSAHRNAEILTRLKHCLILIVDKIITILKQKRFKFQEPEEFDLCWDPFVLVLLQYELSNIVESEQRVNELHKAIKNVLRKIEFKLNHNRLLINLLLQFYTCKSISGFVTSIEDIVACFENPSPVNLTLRHSFSGIYFLLQIMESIIGKQIIPENAAVLILKILNEQNMPVSLWISEKYWGILEGLCGLGMILLTHPLKEQYGLNRSYRVNKPLLMHPKSGSSTIKIVFFPYKHSGAYTYSQELITYLQDRSDVELYVIDFSAEVFAYSIMKSKNCIHITIPIDRQFHDNKRFQNISDNIADNYFSRVSELIKRDFSIPCKAIFHFNHPTGFNRFIPIIRDKFNAITVLTWHFVLEPFAKQEFVNKVNTTHETQLNNYINFNYDKPKKYNGIICVSHFAQQVLTKHYEISPEKIRVIWNGTSNWKLNNQSENVKNVIKRKFG
ncbi:MAG TPA: lanthionine synthetase LanC family protein, partial [Ignavibacteria bacterium]|nr:lanthionine synthetase LanC family protein [Ignavibacteria bacterium]